MASTNTQMYNAKALALQAFVDERYIVICQRITFDLSKRVRHLSGEKKQFVFNSFEIIQKYVNKFFDVRGSDIEARFNTRAGVSGNSYAKHMRPNMINEFDRAYQTLLQYLNYNVFDTLLNINTSEQFLPRILKDGTIRYNDDKNDKKDKKEKEEIETEICEKIGPCYAPSYIFYKQNKNNKFNNYRPISSGKDSWNDFEEPSYRFKITIPKVVDDKWVNTYEYF
jgi:hypothetical protein